MYARDEAVIATPIGAVRVTGDGTHLTGIHIEPADTPEQDGSTPSLQEAARQLRAYFAGERDAFDLPLAPAGTPRGEELRAAMRGIGYGEAMSYGALARTIGSGARAVGQACRRNPFPIVVPCHRVTSASGPEKYTAGDGPSTKQWLRDHEQRHRSTP